MTPWPTGNGPDPPLRSPAVDCSDHHLSLSQPHCCADIKRCSSYSTLKHTKNNIMIVVLCLPVTCGEVCSWWGTCYVYYSNIKSTLFSNDCINVPDIEITAFSNIELNVNLKKLSCVNLKVLSHNHKKKYINRIEALVGAVKHCWQIQSCIAIKNCLLYFIHKKVGLVSKVFTFNHSFRSKSLILNYADKYNTLIQTDSPYLL